MQLTITAPSQVTVH
jgi:hypothetical protein